MTILESTIPTAIILIVLCSFLHVQLIGSISPTEPVQTGETDILEPLTEYSQQEAPASCNEDDEENAIELTAGLNQSHQQIKDEKKSFPNLRLRKPECGFAPLNSLTPRNRTHKTRGYIIGGRNATPGEWPSFAGIGIVGKQMTCGGVIINERQVLTAGWCVYNETANLTMYQPYQLGVVTGVHSLWQEDPFTRTYNVIHICSNATSTWNGLYFEKDYAVLTVGRDIEFDDYVQPACLPENDNLVNVRGKCFTVGQGANYIHYFKAFYHKPKVRFPYFVQKLQVVEAPCKKFWGIPEDDEKRICFDRKVPDLYATTCDEDDGDPVLCLSPENRWTIAGLVSLIPEKCRGAQSVFTNVRLLLREIREQCKI